MKGIQIVPASMRTTRARVLAPRLLVYSLLAILCVAGMRAILAGPAEPAPRPSGATANAGDPAAEAFAEGFARAYLHWDPAHPEERERALAGYLSSSLDSGGGVLPAPGARQEVTWTAAMRTRPSGSLLNVTVAVQTASGEQFHLTVPVARDRRGFLSVAAYPALVGAPPVNRAASTLQGVEVTDASLESVITRALTNYLAGAQQNLSADLTPDAVVSLPEQRMSVTTVGTPTWVVVDRRVAAEVRAEDETGNAWTLRYELEVRESDRWYVRAIDVNPTLKGGS